MIVENIDVDKAIKLQQPMPVMVVIEGSRVLHRLSTMWTRSVFYHCQSCGELLAEEPPKTKRVNYCPHCGQKQWWNKNVL